MSITTEQIWHDFHAPLLHFIRTRVADESSAEDIVQEVFLKIHRHIDTLKDAKKLESWVYQIARHALIDYYRSKEQPGTSLATAEAQNLAAALPDDDVISELFPAVRAMVKSLPAYDRQALVLTEYQGLTQKEFAERLGLSFSGAKSRVQRARAKLKRLLLECCHFELDRRGGVIDYQPQCQCCATGTCACDDAERVTGNTQVRPF
jgi:RNA polymerase sigma-70 factor, ECF subfamily